MATAKNDFLQCKFNYNLVTLQVKKFHPLTLFCYDSENRPIME